MDLQQRREIEKFILEDLRRHGPIYRALKKEFGDGIKKEKEDDDY